LGCFYKHLGRPDCPAVDPVLLGGGNIKIDALGGDDRVDRSDLSAPAAVNGGDGNDVITSGGGADVLTGGSGGDGSDLICGSAGNDTIDGVLGADGLQGNARDDCLISNDGEIEHLFGDGGADTTNSDKDDYWRVSKRFCDDVFGANLGQLALPEQCKDQSGASSKSVDKHHPSHNLRRIFWTAGAGMARVRDQEVASSNLVTPT
jgi:hypothetical protein